MRFVNAWRLGAAAILAATLAAAPALAQWDRAAEGKFDRTLQVSGEVDLDVRTGSGGVKVRSGSGNAVVINAQVRVRADRRRSMAEAERLLEEILKNPPIEQSGNTIRIGRMENDEELRRNVSISYDIVTPAATRLRAGTGSGSVYVLGLSAALEANTGSGSVDIEQIGGEVRASTGSGSIRATNIKGGLRANTGSGGIRGTGVGGSVTASTGSGSIEIEQISGGDADVRTGSGGIRITGVHGTLRAHTGSGSIRADGTPTGNWRLQTSSGGITVRLPAEAGFELDARTSSGSIDTSHPVTLQGRINRRAVRGRVRGGGPLIELSTSSGTIRVE